MADVRPRCGGDRRGHHPGAGSSSDREDSRDCGSTWSGGSGGAAQFIPPPTADRDVTARWGAGSRFDARRHAPHLVRKAEEIGDRSIRLSTHSGPSEISLKGVISEPAAILTPAV